MNQQDIRQRLESLAEPKFAQFASKLMPGVNGVLGVRIPLLRQMARQIADEHGTSFRDVFAPMPADRSAPDESFEETMLRGLVLSYLHVPLSTLFDLVDDFVPLIGNWSVCDSTAAGLKAFRCDRPSSLRFLAPYLESDRGFFARFGAVMILDHFADPAFLTRALQALSLVRCPSRDAQMGVAWAYSVFFAKWPKETESALVKANLSDETRRLTLRKIHESNRVSLEGKSRAQAFFKRGRLSVS